MPPIQRPGFSAGRLVLVRPRLYRDRLTFSNRSDVREYVLILGVSRRIHQGSFAHATVG